MYLEKNSFSHLRLRLRLRLKIVLLDLLETCTFHVQWFICFPLILLSLIISVTLTTLLRETRPRGQRLACERE